MIRVEFEGVRLQVHVVGTDSGETVLVDFERITAFRVMDEGDILEFWPACSTPRGWIFEIHEGGWLAQERARIGGGVGLHFGGLREFLVTGDNDCVSVLSIDPPAVWRRPRPPGLTPPESPPRSSR